MSEYKVIFRQTMAYDMPKAETVWAYGFYLMKKRRRLRELTKKMLRDIGVEI